MVRRRRFAQLWKLSDTGSKSERASRQRKEEGEGQEKTCELPKANLVRGEKSGHAKDYPCLSLSVRYVPKPWVQYMSRPARKGDRPTDLAWPRRAEQSTSDQQISRSEPRGEPRERSVEQCGEACESSNPPRPDSPRAAPARGIRKYQTRRPGDRTHARGPAPNRAMARVRECPPALFVMISVSSSVAPSVASGRFEAAAAAADLRSPSSSSSSSSSPFSSSSASS